MSHQFYYLTTDILSKVQNESLYLEDGGEKDFNTASIGEDDLPFLKTLLKKTANQVFVMLHKMSKDITQDDLDTVGVTSPFIWDNVIPDQTGNYICYLVVFPDELDSNLTDPIDSAIERCLIASTLYEWYQKKRRMTEALMYEKDQAIKEVKRLINYRKSLSKTYNRY